MPEHAKAAVTDDAIVNAILIHASSIGASEILHHNVHLREKFMMHTMPKNPAQASSMVICKPVGMAPADMSLLTTLGVTYVLIFPVPCPPGFGGLLCFLSVGPTAVLHMFYLASHCSGSCLTPPS